MGFLDWLMRLHPASYPSLWLASIPGICAFRHIDSDFLVLRSSSAADGPSSHTLIACVLVPARSAASQTWEIKCREYRSRVGRAASKNSTNRAGCYTYHEGKMCVAALRCPIRCQWHCKEPPASLMTHCLAESSRTMTAECPLTGEEGEGIHLVTNFGPAHWTMICTRL